MRLYVIFLLGMALGACDAKKTPRTDDVETNITASNPQSSAPQTTSKPGDKQAKTKQTPTVNPNVAIYETRKETVEDFPKICGAVFGDKFLEQRDENRTDIHALVAEAGYIENKKQVGEFGVRIDIKENATIRRYKSIRKDNKFTRELVTSPYVGWSCSLEVTSLKHDSLNSIIGGHLSNAEKVFDQEVKKHCILQGSMYPERIYETLQKGSTATLTIGVEYSSQDFLNCKNNRYADQLYDEASGITDVSGTLHGIGRASGVVYLYNERVNPSLIKAMSDGFKIMVGASNHSVTDSKRNIIGRLDRSGYIVDQQQIIIGRYDPLAYKPR